MRTRQAGDPIHGARPRTTAEMISRLMRKALVVDRGFVSPCWEYEGYRIAKDYGYFSIGRTKVLAHRAAWMLRFGDPGDLCVLHRCDNPPCFRPSHLFLGTRADNNADMERKGRARKRGMAGEEHHQARLTENDVRAIREAAEDRSIAAVARQFGMSYAQTHRIVFRQSWKHVS